MNLTEQQLASFKEKYANVIVNSMTLKECQELIFNQICDDFDNMSLDEIIKQTVKQDRQLVDSLIKEVTSENINITNKLDLLNNLKKTMPSCKNVDFKLFGLSLATINLIISLIISAISITLIKYEKNK